MSIGKRRQRLWQYPLQTEGESIAKRTKAEVGRHIGIASHSDGYGIVELAVAFVCLNKVGGDIT